MLFADIEVLMLGLAKLEEESGKRISFSEIIFDNFAIVNEVLDGWWCGTAFHVPF
jgi:hypothetical protein